MSVHRLLTAARQLLGAAAIGATALVTLVVGAPTRALAQADRALPALVPLHHTDTIPDYVGDLLAEGAERLVPPPPPGDISSRFLPPTHRDRAPNYAAALRIAEPPAIDIPPPPPGHTPAVVRGLYLNAWVFSSRRFFDLVALADTTEINAFVIDVKDATGYLTYRSSVPTAVAIGANGMVRANDARARLATLEQHGIHAIARIVVARDPLLARGKPGWAIHDAATGALWRDGLGEPWVDAFCDSVWIYAADVAAEAIVLGFKEIQFDYVRFPDEPPRRLERTVYPWRLPHESKRAAIRQNVALLRDRVHALHVPFTVDVFGLTTSATGDLGIGQVWDDLADAADVVLPMVYPSHYRRGSYGIASPNRAPYEIVRHALEDAIARSRDLRSPARIRPYLQAFTIYRVRYGPEEIRDQIRAAEELGLTDWILWNARGMYPAKALRPSHSLDRPVSRIATPADDAG